MDRPAIRVEDVPLEIQLMRDLVALREKLAAAALSDADRRALQQKINDTALQLNVLHELHGHPRLVNPDIVL